MHELISVVIPVYNAADKIKDCLDSVWSQSGVTLEVIVVDDGSTDNLAERVHEICGDSVRYIRQDNAGPAAARNRGIREAQGAYIAFLDADDIWLPGKLAKQLHIFESNQALGLCFTDMKHYENGMKVHDSYLHEKNYVYASGGWIYENLLRHCFVFTPTVMVRKRVLDDLGGFNESFKIGEDYELWLRISSKYEADFIDEPLVIRHRHADNITSDSYLYLSSVILMMEQELAKHPGNSLKAKLIKKYLAELHFNLGYDYFCKFNLAKARETTLKSIGYNKSIKSFVQLFYCFLPASAIQKLKALKFIIRPEASER